MYMPRLNAIALRHINRRADQALKTEGVKGYKTFLKETIEDYGLDKNDLFELLFLCKNKDVARTLELIAKYEKA